MESFEIKQAGQNTEKEAESLLDQLLADSDNAFLTEHTQHQERIDAAPTAREALKIAEQLIERRLEATFKFSLTKEIEGIDLDTVNVQGIRQVIERIKKHQKLIGEGGDAYVVVDKNELRELPPEVCYKFAKAESTPRGRNTMEEEVKLQSDFHQAATRIEGSRIGVPTPFYMTELGRHQLIAMEKLPAKSVNDILARMGHVPAWLDIDEFCDELQKFFTVMHAQKMYHRDMHPGNIMIRQTPDIPEDGTWGYVIDFGLSGYGEANLDPYRKEVAGTVFTYDEDNAIIKKVKKLLEQQRKIE